MDINSLPEYQRGVEKVERLGKRHAGLLQEKLKDKMGGEIRPELQGEILHSYGMMMEDVIEHVLPEIIYTCRDRDELMGE